jgi:hypothetical protein
MPSMTWSVRLFEVASAASLIGIIYFFVVRSVRTRRVHPGIWLTLAIIAISWLEAPFDRAMYVQFHPDMYRLPPVGPLAATHGGLPVVAPAGYVMYYLLPALVAIAIVDRLAVRWRLDRRRALVLVSVAIGLAFDLIMQFGPARLVPIWVFSRTAPYVTAFPGTRGQVPLYEPLAMALMITWSACLLGMRDANGDTHIERGARRWARSPGRRLVVTGLGYILALHVLYLYVVLPFLILWRGQMLTVTGDLRPFPSIPEQPAGPQSHGPLGAVLVVVWLCAGIIATYLFASRMKTQAPPDGQSAAPLDTPVAPTPDERAKAVQPGHNCIPLRST